MEGNQGTPLNPSRGFPCTPFPHGSRDFALAHWRQTMSTEENKVLVRRWFTALNAAENQVIDDFFFPNFIYHLPGGQSQLEGRNPFKQFIIGFHAAFPDLHYTIEDLIAEGDRVVARWTSRGTNT